MRVFVCPSSDETGKFLGVVKAFPDIWKGRILDVGCRSGNLKHILLNHNPEVHYCGIDLYPPADILANLEEGLPFDDKKFDIVVALDVLEHTGEIHRAFEELCRVAKKFVLVTLPNMYELRARIKFLFGFQLSGKYGLPVDPPKDRHRWFFSLREAVVFIHTLGKRYNFEVVKEGCIVGPLRSNIRVILGLFPNLLSPCYLALLRRRGDL